MAVTVHSAWGHITLVQEERFRLVIDTGQGFLFTLAHNANVSAQDLQRFHTNHTRVLVAYDGEPDLASGVARSIREAGPG